MDKQPEGILMTLKYPSNACLSYLDNGLGILPPVNR